MPVEFLPSHTKEMDRPAPEALRTVVFALLTTATIHVALSKFVLAVRAHVSCTPSPFGLKMRGVAERLESDSCRVVSMTASPSATAATWVREAGLATR